MSKHLEQIFNMPEPDDESKSDSEETDEINSLEQYEVAKSAIEKIEDSLPQVSLESSDRELDELARMAEQAYKDVFDIGMNVEARHIEGILGVASNFLSHAISAKEIKIKKKLKMIELQLKKAKLDSDNPDNTPMSTGTAVDRNEMINEFLKSKKSDKKE